MSNYKEKLKALQAKKELKSTKQEPKMTEQEDIGKGINMTEEATKQDIEEPETENPTYHHNEQNPQNVLIEIIGKEALDRMAEANIIPVPNAQLTGLVQSHTEITKSLEQYRQQLELAKEKISSQSEKLKNQKGLIRKFYQLEAATIGAKEALEAMLKCFNDTNQGLQGWPTMQVFTPDGWVKGSVDYNLHNAVLLAKTATTSENLQVIEKHIRGFTDQIKTLQIDVDDLQRLVPFKLEKCGNCRKYKKVNSKCWNCGKDQSEMDFLDEDDDDD